MSKGILVAVLYVFLTSCETEEKTFTSYEKVRFFTEDEFEAKLKQNGYIIESGDKRFSSDGWGARDGDLNYELMTKGQTPTEVKAFVSKGIEQLFKKDNPNFTFVKEEDWSIIHTSSNRLAAKYLIKVDTGEEKNLYQIYNLVFKFSRSKDYPRPW